MSRHKTRRSSLVTLVLFLSTPLINFGAGESLTGATESNPLETAMSYIQSHRHDLGLTDTDLAETVVSDQYVSRHTGVSHIYLLQHFNGIEVKNGILNLSIAPNGTVVHVGQRFVTNLATRVSGAPALSAIEALHHASSELGLASPLGVQILVDGTDANKRTVFTGGNLSQNNIPARLVYQPLATGQVRLAWDLVIDAFDQSNWWNVRIDAENGRMLAQNNFVAQETYKVYPLPIESPNHTSPPPPLDARQKVVDPFTASSASPFGWHDTDGVAGPEYTITRGNNVHAYADTNADNQPDTGVNAEPNGGTSLDFTGMVVPIDLSQEPEHYTQASIANLFYWNNINHDVLWEYGFDEVSGNFQATNYSSLGLGGDDVQAEAQDGSEDCIANFGTPPEGQRPRMQVGTCGLVMNYPRRDGNLDHGVVTHEYGHGVSNRLTGGPNNTSCLSNLEQMGEGWSDYLALMFTMKTGDVDIDERDIGTYLLGRGARPAPYSTDPMVNNFKYSNILGIESPHDIGFVWATMLWEMTWNLVDKHGFNADIYGDSTTGGNNLALQLVIDGMKMQPCNPGFVDGRNAILAADDALTGNGSFSTGVNQCTIWNSFANRGLGFSADQDDPDSVCDGAEAFDNPPWCATIGAPIERQNICQGDPALFRIGVGNQFTLPPVALSISGEPDSATVAIMPSTLETLPGISELAISDTGAVAAGSYDIAVTGLGIDPNFLETHVELNVFDSAPIAGPGLIAPADEAINQPIMPTFIWTEIGDASSYTLEIDDDPEFGSIEYTASGIVGSSHKPTIELDFETQYSWRVRGDNPCGSGSLSTVFSFISFPLPDGCMGFLPPKGKSENNPQATANRSQTGGIVTTAQKFSPIADLDVEATSQNLVKPGTLGIGGKVTNLGPDSAICTVAEATLDPNVTFVSTIGCAEDPGGVPACNFGTILNDNFAEYCIVALAPAGVFHHEVSASSLTFDDNPANNSDSVVTTVGLLIFADSFESGDTSAWSTTTP